MLYHKVLEKQIKKLLPEKYLKEERIRAFLALISNSYSTFERDKQLSEHAFAISEREYQEVTRNLQEQNQIKHHSIVKLKEAIKSLDSNAPDGLNEASDDLISIISYLEKQIKKTKELENELIHAKEMAEKAAKVKSDFLSVMSHEIRTPLNAIIGNVHLLRQEDPLPSQEEYLAILHISSRNLLSLVNDILDFGKIEEGKVIFAEKDLNIRQLLNNIKSANRIRAEEKGNKLKVMFDEDIPPFVKGDDVRLNQVLNNLVSNALKFTTNGCITIEVQLKQTTEEHVLIDFAVLDNGIGIHREKQELIFERFTQANSDITREFGGSGLGLTIIRHLLHLQNSEIYVQSEAGKGSRFYFSLIFKKSDRTRKEEVQQSGVQNLHGIKVLLVEDVEFNVLVAEKMLQSWNATIEVAGNGLIAIEKARNNKYDLILMDLQMPVMDGYSAASAIREFDKNIPIIALTASSSIDIQDKVYIAGMNDYISKPFNPDDLYFSVHQHTYACRRQK